MAIPKTEQTTGNTAIHSSILVSREDGAGHCGGRCRCRGRCRSPALQAEGCRHSESEDNLNFLIVPSMALCQNPASLFSTCCVALCFLKYSHMWKLNYVKIILLNFWLLYVCYTERKKNINSGNTQFFVLHRKGFIMLL